MAKQPDKYKQRKDGRYFTQVSTGRTNEKGKPERIPLYASTSKELEKLVAKVKYEVDHGSYASDKGTLFGDYAKHWLSVAKATRSDATNAMYENILNNHIDLLKNKKIGKITKSDIQEQINNEMEHPRICQQMRLTIRQILNYAVEDGLVVRNVCQSVDLPRRVVKEKRALTEAEKEAIKHSNFTVIEKAYIYTLLGTGIRPGELHALTKADINEEKKEIYINKALTFQKNTKFLSKDYPKTNAGIRTIPLPTKTLDALKELMNINKNFILFCDKTGQYMTKSAYENIFNQANQKINDAIGGKGISEARSKLTAYIFRHNYCTELYYAGVSLKEAQRLMGHESYKMIMEVYSHLDEKKENTREKIESLCM